MLYEINNEYWNRYQWNSFVSVKMNGSNYGNIHQDDCNGCPKSIVLLFVNLLLFILFFFLFKMIPTKRKKCFLEVVAPKKSNSRK